MYLGYGSLSGVEVWSNARVIDYLRGDPLAGVAGLGCTGTFVNPNAACRSILPMVCDPPPRFGEWVVEFNTIEDAFNWYPGVATSIAFGEATQITIDSIFVFAIVPTPGFNEVPELPPDADAGWTDLGYSATNPVPYRGTTPKTDPCSANFSKLTFSLPGNSGSFYIYGYTNSCTGEFLWSSDDGISWSRYRKVIVAVEDPAASGRYSDPVTDDAPWFDPLVPESADFAGLYVEEMTGFDAPVVRDIADSSLNGGSLGPLRLRTRSMTVTGWLHARTCCAAEYGLSWLTEALMGQTGCDDCALGDFQMFRCCPPESDADPDPVDYVRLMHRVGLTDGPKVLDRAGVCCSDCGSTMLRVQFTLTSELPWIFSDAEWAAFEDDFNSGIYEYDLSAPCSASNCPEAPAPWVPDCAVATPPAPAPYRLSDPCYCEPWETMRRCVSFENTNQWNEVTTVIVVKAGQDEVRNLKLVAFKNQQGLECPCDYENDDYWRCVAPCATLAVSQIPAGATLTVDSRVRSVTMVLAGGEQVSGLQFVSALDSGAPFGWFDVGHCTSLCMVASIGASSVTELACDSDTPSEDCEDGFVTTITVPDALISIGLVNRYAASGS